MVRKTAKSGHRPRKTSTAAEKALRLERITTLADRVFGNSDKAHRWLCKPKRTLDGATPMDVVANETGARTVEEMLYRIGHGMFA